MNGQTQRLLARLVHRAWCESLAEEGWRYGPTFDPVQRTHDALVPFGKLHATDQWTLLVSVYCSGLGKGLESVVDYPRGLDQVFRPEEMRVGLPVRLSLPPESQLLSKDGPEIGLIVRWEEEDNPRHLTQIVVRWPDGEETEHLPEERELLRVE